MQQFEREYAALVAKVLQTGERRETRNGFTRSTFGESITIHSLVNGIFPIIQARKMYPKGVLGEYAAMLRQPKSVADFKKWGCNYWDKWADENGKLTVDYGNAWFDFDGFNQVEELKRCLRDDPMNRRMIINSWRPNRLGVLSLPCCHYNYQFYVTANGYLHMIWTQRSVDMMIGLPSDFVLAAVMLISIAREFSLLPGSIKFDLGDCHVYEEHLDNAHVYIDRTLKSSYEPPRYNYRGRHGDDFCSFEPDLLDLGTVDAGEPINFLLKE